MRVLPVRCLWLIVILLVPMAATSGPWHAALHKAHDIAMGVHDHGQDRNSDAPVDESHCPAWQLLHMPMLAASPVALPLLTDRINVLDECVVSLHTLTVEHQHSGRGPPQSLLA